MEKVVLVANTEICQYSVQQIDFLKNENLQIKGAIMCNEEKNKNSDICQQVEAFPTFCNTESKKCVVGLKTNVEEIKQINDL